MLFAKISYLFYDHTMYIVVCSSMGNFSHIPSLATFTAISIILDCLLLGLTIPGSRSILSPGLNPRISVATWVIINYASSSNKLC